MVIIFLADGFEECEALCPLDMLRRAKVDVKTVSINENKSVTGAHNITVLADLTAQELQKSTEQIDMVILPGGMPGTKNLESSELVKSYVLNTYNNGGYIGAICAAPYILADLGILDSKKGTCYPEFKQKFVNAEYISQGVVADGKIITARAAGSAFEFGAELVRCICEESTVKNVLDGMIYR